MLQQDGVVFTTKKANVLLLANLIYLSLLKSTANYMILKTMKLRTLRAGILSKSQLRKIVMIWRGFSQPKGQVASERKGKAKERKGKAKKD